MNEDTKSYLWILIVYYTGVIIGFMLAHVYLRGFLQYLFQWW